MNAHLLRLYSGSICFGGHDSKRDQRCSTLHSSSQQETKAGIVLHLTTRSEVHFLARVYSTLRTLRKQRFDVKPKFLIESLSITILSRRLSFLADELPQQPSVAQGG